MPILNPEHAYREYVPPLPQGAHFTEHHIKVRREDLSRYVLIPGSHLRGRLIAEALDDCRVISATRGYYLYTGYWRGERFSVCSTGMGGPVAAIAMEELGNLGCDTFIRVGSAGAISPQLGLGDLVIATASVRGGGTANRYLPSTFPAVANFAMTEALVRAGRAAGVTTHVGLIATGDAFYAPVPEMDDQVFKQAGVLAIEMEADTLFAIGLYRGWRVGAGFVLDGGEAIAVGESSSAQQAIADHATHGRFKESEATLVTIALNAMHAIARTDRTVLP